MIRLIAFLYGVTNVMYGKSREKNNMRPFFIYISVFEYNFLFLLQVSLYKRQLNFSILNIRSILILSPQKRNIRIQIAIADT